jgi:hypothetical protein
MADEEDVSLDVGNLQTGTNDIPSLTYGEQGFSGLTILGGRVLEECSHELRWPQCIDTYKRMAKDGAIAPALELVEMMIARVPWTVKVPEGYEEKLKFQANYLRQVKDDMDHSWDAAIKQIVSFNRYGFACVEKVYGHREKAKGSKYNDGLVRIKKLALRPQDTIESWKTKNNGRDLAGFYQYVILPTNSPLMGSDFVNNPSSAIDSSLKPVTKFIKRAKFLHFRNAPLKDNPEGTSPLNGAWQAWKYKQAYQESEAIAVAQDSNGFKVLYLPPQYMATDASEENKAVFEEYKKILANMHQAKQSGMILPLILDENGNKMFEFDIKSVTGQKSYDTNAIIGRYTSEILTALFADFLALGSSGSGSFSLAETKVSIIEMTLESKLNEIKDQLNNDLVRQLWELNAWDTDVMPYFDYGNISKESLDEIGKFLQRVTAVGMMPKTPAVVNWVMKQADIPFHVDESLSVEELSKMLSPMETGSGQGMTEGLPSGTGNNSGSSGDSSTSNNENV